MDIGGIEVIGTGSRLLTAEDVAEVTKHIEQLESENAKLRELVRDYEHCSVHTDCAKCEYDGKMSEHCPYSPCFPDDDELCELGVEV